MSIGIGGRANLIIEDGEYIVYEYGGYNLNDPEFRNAEHRYDGIISIHRSGFSEPEIHSKIKLFPGGRKKVITKRIVRQEAIFRAFEDGKIIIENCSNSWALVCANEKTDRIAIRLADKILTEYQETGVIPHHVSYHV